MVLLGIGLQIGISVLLSTIATIKPDWFEDYGKLMEQLGMGNSAISILYLALIAPISEELIFRGGDIRKKQKGDTICNILQAILFGIYHMNLIQGIYAFVIGMFLGMVCIKFKSLYAPIILHMIINVSGIILGIGLTEEILNIPAVMVAMMILSIAAIVFSSIKLSKNQMIGKEKEFVIE